jgi:hypothetical protein
MLIKCQFCSTGSGPNKILDPDPTKFCGSDWIRIRNLWIMTVLLLAWIPARIFTKQLVYFR